MERLLNSQSQLRLVSSKQNHKIKTIMKPASLDQELEALKTILHALEPLDGNQRRFVLKTVAERMGVSMPIGGHDNTGGTATGSSNTSLAARTGGTTEGRDILDGQTAKHFLKSKLPKTDVQRIACLGYYLTNARSQPYFKTLDLTKLNTEAGGTPFSNASLAVGNATSFSKFLGSVGQGKKQITALGEDVVAALPDQEAVKTVLASHRKPRKKRTKKAATK
jgi:hypothetical protein